MDEIEELITTVLDVLALLLIATGVGWLVWQVLPGAAFLAAGVVLLTGSVLWIVCRRAGDKS